MISWPVSGRPPAINQSPRHSNLSQEQECRHLVHSTYAVDYTVDIELNARCEKATIVNFVAVQGLTETTDTNDRDL